MSRTSCPSHEDLLGFHLGTLPEQGLDAIAEHLEACPSCRSQVEGLDNQTDLVLGVLRWPGQGQPGPEDVTRHTPAPAQPLPLDLFDPPQEPGELGRLGHYRLLRLIGRGGMGFVFEAEDVRLCRRAAVKVINPGLTGDAEVRRRFLREARALAGIRPGEHVVTVYDVDENHQVPYLAMELLEGQPLDRWLAGRGPVPVADILRLGREAALGLQAAHDKGLIHRDIKPANLWVEAGTGRVKVLDFGLARGAANEGRLTDSNIVAGTPAYMSPEQAHGDPLDLRTDLFSLGCVLYELCAGRPAFRGTSPFGVITALAVTDPPPLRKVRPDLPAPLAQLVTELLDKEPERRPPSARAVADRLAAIVPDSGARPRGRTWAAVVTAVAAVLLGALVVMRVQTSKGTVEIEADPGVKVVVEKDGEQVTILDPVSKQQVELRAGEYHVKLAAGGEGLKLSTDHFTLRRGEKEIVRVRRVEPPRPADAWLRQVAGLKPDEKARAVIARLRSLNPEFKAEAISEIRDGAVYALRFRSDNVRDISPLKALSGLRELDCSGALPNSRLLADLSPLKGLQLLSLHCSNSGVADLSPLKGMRLDTLMCYNTKVADLSPLEGMPLTVLNVGMTAVKDLSPIKGMPLRLLGCGQTNVTDLSPAKGMKLDALWCNNTGVSDLSPIKGMPLTDLLCANTRVASLEPLVGMRLKRLGWDVRPGRDADIVRGISTLETINGRPAAEAGLQAGLSGDEWARGVAGLRPEAQVAAVTARLRQLNPEFKSEVSHRIEAGVVRGLSFRTDSVRDISPVKALRGLRYLDCSGTSAQSRQFTDLSPLKGLELTQLECHHTGVADLSPLSGMKLTRLNCSWTRVASLAPLKDMKLTELYCDYSNVADLTPLKDMKLTILNCGVTGVSDLTPLKDMKLTFLSVGEAEVEDLSPLRGMKLTTLWCNDTKVSDLSPLKGMELTVFGCHNAKVTDLSALAGMPLRRLTFDRAKVDLKVLRSIPTLETINGKKAADFRRDEKIPD